jgi:hypothetical protein
MLYGYLNLGRGSELGTPGSDAAVQVWFLL